MELGAHLWVYCQLALRPLGWERREEAFGQVVDGLEAALADFAAGGFDGFESMVDLVATPAARAAHERAVAATGVRLLGLSANAAFWDPAERGAIVDKLADACAWAAPLGGVHLGLSATPPNRAKTPADYAAQAETFRALAAAVKPLGVQPNLHTYSRDAADDYREVREMIERVEADSLTLGPDLAWLRHGGGDPVEFIERFGGRMNFCHVRDIRADGQWAEGIGDGVEDWPALGAALRRVAFAGPVIFEPAFPDDAPTRPLRETWRASATRLRQILDPADT